MCVRAWNKLTICLVCSWTPRVDLSFTSPPAWRTFASIFAHDALKASPEIVLKPDWSNAKRTISCFLVCATNHADARRILCARAYMRVKWMHNSCGRAVSAAFVCWAWRGKLNAKSYIPGGEGREVGAVVRMVVFSSNPWGYNLPKRERRGHLWWAGRTQVARLYSSNFIFIAVKIIQIIPLDVMQYVWCMEHPMKVTPTARVRCAVQDSSPERTKYFTL